MKKLFCIAAICTVLSIATKAQTQQAQDSTKNKPTATYEVGAARVTVWENKRSDGSVWKNFSVEKRYKKDGVWKTSHSFTEKELLELKAAIDKAINEQSVKTKK